MKKFMMIGLILLSGCTFQSRMAVELTGKNQDYVLKKLGSPTVVRSEPPNQVWAYRDEQCSQLIFFDASHTVRFVDLTGKCLYFPDTNSPK